MERFKISSILPWLMALVLILCIQDLFAENIRGTVAGVIKSTNDQVVFRPENLVVIDVESVSEYQDGIELRIEIHPDLLRYRNTFALLLFRNVSPPPTEDNPSYSGTRVYMRLLPSRESMFVRIPFSQNHEMSGDALTHLLPQAVGFENFPLIATVVPVMKGIPDTAFDHSLNIQAVPLWKNKGSLVVEITNPSGDVEEVFTILVDGKPVTPKSPITLESGIHKVRITSTHAPAVERVVAVEPGKTVNLSVPLDYSPPQMTLRAPEGAIILLDGQQINIQGSTVVLEIEPGNHEITGQLGDLRLSKQFTIPPGGKINVELIVDIEIVEEEKGSGNTYGSGEG